MATSTTASGFREPRRLSSDLPHAVAASVSNSTELPRPPPHPVRLSFSDFPSSTHSPPATMLASVSTLALVTSIAVSSVDAHSYMSVPKPTFPDQFYQPMSPFARINGESFPGAAGVPSYKGPEKIAAAIKSSGAKTLRQFVMTNMNITMTDMVKQPTKECGMSQANGARQALTDTVEWTWAHPGPCEIWCDNTRLFFNADCSGNNVGNVKIDKSKCKGANFLQGMYVGTHVPNWEVYVNCVPLEGGSSTNAAAVFKTNAPGDGAAAAGGDSDADADAGSDSGASTPAPSKSTKPATTSAAPGPAASSVPSTSAPAGTTKPTCTKRRRN